MCAIRSMRSCGFFNPANTILFPFTNFFGHIQYIRGKKTIKWGREIKVLLAMTKRRHRTFFGFSNHYCFKIGIAERKGKTKSETEKGKYCWRWQSGIIVPSLSYHRPKQLQPFSTRRYTRIRPGSQMLVRLYHSSLDLVRANHQRRRYDIVNISFWIFSHPSSRWPFRPCPCLFSYPLPFFLSLFRSLLLKYARQFYLFPIAKIVPVVIWNKCAKEVNLVRHCLQRK